MAASCLYWFVVGASQTEAHSFTIHGSSHHFSLSVETVIVTSSDYGDMVTKFELELLIKSPTKVAAFVSGMQLKRVYKIKQAVRDISPENIAHLNTSLSKERLNFLNSSQSVEQQFKFYTDTVLSTDLFKKRFETTWGIINNETNVQKQIKIKVGDRLVEDGTEIASRFNEFFASVADGQELSSINGVGSCCKDALHLIIQELPEKNSKPRHMAEQTTELLISN
ncbi:hypothetical protein J6590_081162 [Homalodisca vitripennis]|nr:hypothetical protein J6590_081162 [Homalodisca vitripennis]